MHHQCLNIYWFKVIGLYFPFLQSAVLDQKSALKTTHHCQQNPVLLTGNVLQGLGKLAPSFPDLWMAKAWRVSSPARHTGEESVLGMLDVHNFICEDAISRPKLKSIASALLLSHSSSLKAWPLVRGCINMLISQCWIMRKLTVAMLWWGICLR